MEHLDIFITLGLLTFLCYKVYFGNRINNLPAVPNLLPFIGQTWEIRSQGRIFLAKWRKALGEVYTVSYLGKNVVIVAGKEAVKMARTPGLDMVEARNEVTLIGDALGNYIESEGKPSVTLDADVSVKKFLGPLLNDVLPSLLIKMQTKIKDLSNHKGPIQLSRICTGVVGETVSSLLMGEKLANDKDLTNIMIKFATDVEQRARRYLIWTLFPFIGFKIAKFLIRSTDFAPEARKVFLTKISHATNQRNQLAIQDRPSPTCFLEAMIDSGFPNETIVDGLINLTFASLFTTMSNSQRLVGDFLTFPEYIKEVRQELDSVLPNGEPLTVDKIPHLEHLDSAIRESLRHRSHIPELWRKTTSPLVLTDGQIIPQDTYIALDIPSIQLSPTSYGTSPRKPDMDPVAYATHFDPFRFVDTSLRAPKLTSSFYGFGAGKHACPGRFFAVQIITSFTAILLQNYRVETVDDQPLPFITKEEYFPDPHVRLIPLQPLSS